MNLENIEWFNDYINIINNLFSIIITYSFGENKNNLLEFTIIKVPNRGADIGPKMIVIDYLKDKEYTHVLFLHSKSDKYKRDLYLKKLLVDKNGIKFLTEYEGNGVFPNLLIYKNKNIESISNINDINSLSNWGINEHHINYLHNFLDIKYRDYLFVEGNFYLLDRKICEKIFGNDDLYKRLNDENSFDCNWVRYRYCMHYRSDERMFRTYKKNKLHGNNFATQLGKKGLPDGMIEHAFERIIINTINNINGSYHVVNNEEFENYRISE